MYTRNFREDEKLLIKCILTGVWDNRTIESLASESNIPKSKIPYIINRSKFIRRSKNTKSNIELYTLT